VKETKEGTIDEDLFYFLKGVYNVICLLQGCDRSWSGGPKLGVLMCDGYNGELFSSAWV
jgi:hypothetical protein